VLMYKLRKLRSHFIRGHAWRSSVAILSVRSCGPVELEQNSPCVVVLSCVTLVRGYLSLRSCLRSCGQVLGTPLQAATCSHL